jgi:hypothetical protein
MNIRLAFIGLGYEEFPSSTTQTYEGPTSPYFAPDRNVTFYLPSLRAQRG